MNNSYDMMGLRAIESRLPPGFRFHPSDEELVCYYLRKKQQKANNLQTTAATMLIEVDLHACEPWDLPEVAKLSADEWYFFSFRDRKYATGSRRNRATKQGYWKATGKDKAIHDASSAGSRCRKSRAVAGARKTLVFYFGRAPNGRKSSWVMHEFRLLLPHPKPKFQIIQEEAEDWVLCRVFHKGNNNGGQACESTTPMPISCSSSAPTTAHHLICSLPQQLHAESKLDGLQESLISSPAPLIMSDQDRFVSSIQHYEDNQHHILLDNGPIIISSSRNDDQLGSNEQQQEELLDLSVLRAPTFLELEQSPGGGGTMEMESLLETTCGVLLQGANNYYI